MRIAAATLFLLIQACTAQAGAWPREQGSVFVSASYRAVADVAALGSLRALMQDGYNALYAEYGLTPRLTLGLDAGYAMDGRFSGVGFARWSLDNGSGRNRLALSLGAGLAGPPGETLVQLGAHWGTSLSFGWSDGWMGLDLTAIQRLETDGIAAKADFTFGLAPSDGWKAILQLQAGSYPGADAYLRLAPSIVRRTGAASHIEIGLEAELLGSGMVGAKIGSWIEF